MNERERKYDYLKFRWSLHSYTKMIDIPILIALWYLSAHWVFWTVFGLYALAIPGMGSWLVFRLKELGLK